jgi:anaphase-promoting complex subunit 8
MPVPLTVYSDGLILREMDNKDEALKAFCDSVNTYPWNWSAWKAISDLCMNRKKLNSLQFRKHWMQHFFLADALLELHQHNNDEVLEVLDDLQEYFPMSTHVLSQVAMAYYNLRKFDEAQQLFEELRALDPYRLEQMDTYSNILYVKDSKGPLSFLAHSAVKNDKYRPETCCIIGNYYSVKAEHEKAVMYFRRALKLNPLYLSAWTLMGHELIEMNSIPSAIEAYRSAVDINPRDYRAWHGLGQTYEMLQMHSYSLYYFRQATSLRPFDSRMWCAMAESYVRVGRTDDAIKCYLRAEGNGDREGTALFKLALLYRQLNETLQAARCFARLLKRHQENGVENQQTCQALLNLALYERDRANYDVAAQYCSRVLDLGLGLTDQAKALLEEIRMLKAKAEPGRRR